VNGAGAAGAGAAGAGDDQRTPPYGVIPGSVPVSGSRRRRPAVIDLRGASAGRTPFG